MSAQSQTAAASSAAPQARAASDPRAAAASSGQGAGQAAQASAQTAAAPQPAPAVSSGASDGGKDSGPRQDAQQQGGDLQAAAGPPAPGTDPGQAQGLAAQPVSASFQASLAAQSGPAYGAVPTQTVAQLSSELVRKAQAKATSFDLALEPAGMGRVDVKLRIASDGGLTAALRFDTPQTAEAMKAHAGELRAALEQAGFNLADSGLSFTAGGFGREAQQDNGAGQGWSRPSAPPIPAIETASAVPPAAATLADPSSGLDIRI